MPNKPGPISYPELKQVWGGDFRAQKWPLEGVDTLILGGLAIRCAPSGVDPLRRETAAQLFSALIPAAMPVEAFNGAG